jgi:hypothetical protein
MVCAGAAVAAAGLGVLVWSAADEFPPASIWVYEQHDWTPRRTPGGATVERLMLALFLELDGSGRVTGLFFKEHPTLPRRILARLGLAKAPLRAHSYWRTDQKLGGWVRFSLEEPVDPGATARADFEQVFRQP